jgi:hypothetical protein
MVEKETKMVEEILTKMYGYLTEDGWPGLFQAVL